MTATNEERIDALEKFDDRLLIVMERESDMQFKITQGTLKVVQELVDVVRDLKERVEALEKR